MNTEFLPNSWIRRDYYEKEIHSVTVRSGTYSTDYPFCKFHQNETYQSDYFDTLA